VVRRLQEEKKKQLKRAPSWATPIKRRTGAAKQGRPRDCRKAAPRRDHCTRKGSRLIPAEFPRSKGKVPDASGAGAARHLWDQFKQKTLFWAFFLLLHALGIPLAAPRVFMRPRFYARQRRWGFRGQPVVIGNASGLRRWRLKYKIGDGQHCRAGLTGDRSISPEGETNPFEALRRALKGRGQGWVFFMPGRCCV